MSLVSSFSAIMPTSAHKFVIDLTNVRHQNIVKKNLSKLHKQVDNLTKELEKAKKVIAEKDASIAALQKKNDDLNKVIAEKDAEKDVSIEALQKKNDDAQKVIAAKDVDAVILARKAEEELEEKLKFEAKLKRSGKAGRKNIAENLVIGDLLPKEVGLPRFEVTALKYTFKNEYDEDVTKPAKVKCLDCGSKNEFRLNQRRTHKCVPDLTCKKCKKVVSSAQTMRNHIHKKHGDTQWSGKQTDYFKTEEFKNLYKVLVQ